MIPTVLFLILASISSLFGEGKITLRGEIIATNVIDHKTFIIYFDGDETRNDEDGFYTFTPDASKNYDEMHLLICRTFDPSYGKINSIKELISNPDRYRYFVLTKNQNYNPNPPEEISAHEKAKGKELKPEEQYWNIEEKKLEGNKIPDNCISILIDPKFLKGVVNWSFRINSNEIPIPRVLLRNNDELVADKPERAKKQGYISEASYFSESNALLTKGFHQQVENKTQMFNNGKTEVIVHSTRS